jgi:hypothetical protein
MLIAGGLLFMWDVVPNFQNCVSVPASQKPDFGIPKIENALFVRQNGKQHPWRSLSS